MVSINSSKVILKNILRTGCLMLSPCSTDFNECTDVNPCNVSISNCTNIRGSHLCICKKGFQRNNNNSDCHGKTETCLIVLIHTALFVES